MLFANSPEQIIANIIAVLLGMTIHEFAHCYVADRMGDPTPRSLGRLTLNPFVHIHWLGFLMFVVVGFGILGSAPISPWRMRNPRWGSLLATAAGPFSNLLLAIAAALIFRIIPISLANSFFGTILATIVLFNVILFFFNLIPLFPIDGWRIVLALLPPDLADWWQRNQQTSQLIFIGLLLLSFVRIPGFDILGMLIFNPSFQTMLFLFGPRAQLGLQLAF